MNWCTIGVIFLSTPHRESDFILFAVSVANILKADDKWVNKKILQLLNQNFKILVNIEETYAMWLQRNSSHFNLTCFFKELKLSAVEMVNSILCSQQFACMLLIN